MPTTPIPPPSPPRWRCWPRPSRSVPAAAAASPSWATCASLARPSARFTPRSPITRPWRRSIRSIASARWPPPCGTRCRPPAAAGRNKAPSRSRPRRTGWFSRATWCWSRARPPSASARWSPRWTRWGCPPPRRADAVLYFLSDLSDGGDFFNLFRYITFRAGGAFFTALVFGFLFGRPLINLLRKRQRNGQPIRTDGPESHLATKAGTPTMGGVLILGALVVSTLLWARVDNAYVWITLLVTIAFGAVGFADDYAKVSRGNVKGVPGRVRLAIGFLIAAVAAVAASQ